MFIIFALKDESNRGAMGKTGAGPFFRKLSNALYYTWPAQLLILMTALAMLYLLFGLGACLGE